MIFQRSIYLLVLLYFNILSLNAQIEDEILSFVDSTEMIVNNGRDLLSYQLNYSNIEKSQEIYQFLKEKTELLETHAFYFNEEIALQILFQEWDSFLEMAVTYDQKKLWVCYSYPESILMYIMDAIDANIEIIENGMQLSELTQEDMGLINLYLQVIKSRHVDDEYTEKLKEFKHHYPTSKYNNFVNMYLWRPKTSGHFSFSIGPNYIFPNLEIKEHFEPNVGFSIDLSFNINRLLFSFYVSNTSVHSKYAFTDSTDSNVFNFDDHEAFIYEEVGGIIGYSFFKNKIFDVTAFIPLASTRIESNHFKGEEKENEYKVFRNFTSGLGLNNEIKLWQFRMKDGHSDMNSFLSLKVQVGYNIIFSAPLRDVYYIRTGLVWGFGSF